MNARSPIGVRFGLRNRLLLGLLLVPCCTSTVLAPSASAAGRLPSPSAYGVSALCAAPSPGRSGCLGLRLVAKDPLAVPGARARSDASSSSARVQSAVGSRPQAVDFQKPIKGSLSPVNVLGAYGLTGISPPSTQTIAIVDAYNDPTAEADLETYDEEFLLPSCTAQNGCFTQVNQSGETANPPFPKSTAELEAARGGTTAEQEEAELAEGWAQEIATDVEIARGVCASCHILLVEANSNFNSDLYAAEQTAAAQGATEISNSWGGEEPESDNAAFDHPGIVITASSGDDGYRNWFNPEAEPTANYPASSPHVVAVGGTRLELDEQGTGWENETVWNDGGVSKGLVNPLGAAGGGCSEAFAAPAWQQSLSDWSFVGCGSSRAVADVSADSDPYTGVAVYDSTEDEGEKGWAMIGGTSVASPIIGATFALAGGAQGVEYPARTLYENESRTPSSLHDVVSGSNGECTQPVTGKGESSCSATREAESCEVQAICLAVHGYDGPTGVGTPDGIGAFQATGVAGEGPTGTQTPPQPVPGTSSPGVASPPRPPMTVLSGLSLTHRAIVALNRSRPKVSKVRFAFTLNAPARIRVTISKRVRVHGHVRWKSVSKPFTIAAGSGRQTRGLNGRGALAPGRYELTLTPASGAAKSITFQIG
jgi:hypothetical protein